MSYRDMISFFLSNIVLIALLDKICHVAIFDLQQEQIDKLTL
jgi:hypothetical protein